MVLCRNLKMYVWTQGSWILGKSRVKQVLHKAGYIHRDMKPENMFVQDAGGQNLFTIIDWGIAAVKDDHNTFAQTQTKAWTPFWCPPEQEQGTVSIGNSGDVNFHLKLNSVPPELKVDSSYVILYQHE